MSGMNPGFAAYLANKNNKGDMSLNPSMAPMQPKGKQQASPGVSNSALQSLNNTKAKVATHVPKGKAHAKVMTPPKNMKHGRYL